MPTRLDILGFDQYWIENVGGELWVGGGGHHGHGRGRPGRYAEPLLLSYVIDDNGDLIRSYDDDTEHYARHGSGVAGFFDSAYSFVGGSGYPAWLQVHIKDATTADRQRWTSFAMSIEDFKEGSATAARKNPSDANQQAAAARYASYSTPNGVNTQPDNAFWNQTPQRKADHDAFLARKHVFTIHTSFDLNKDLGDVAHAISKASKVAGKAISNIPVIGAVIHEAIKLNPITAIGNLSAKVLSGERLDHVFLDSAKDAVTAVKDAAPYVKAVAAFIPGVGTGIAAAIAAGTALAEGQSITSALKDSIIAAVPGGSLGQTAARGVMAIAEGENVGKATLDAVKSQLPPSIGPAIDIAVKAAGGQNVKGAILQAIRSNLPPDVQKAVDIATAVSAAANIQKSAVKAIVKPTSAPIIAAVGTKVVAATPKLAAKVPMMTEPAKGFNLAAGLLAHKAVTPEVITALRSTLPAQQQAGFDTGLKAINDINNPTWTSLVSHGNVLRGDWRAVSKTSPGATLGRNVAGDKVALGWYARTI